MFDTFTPRPTAGWTLRRRADGTAGICDPTTVTSVEVSTDETSLAEAIDGNRSLSQIAEAHAQAHGFIPFIAFRDLLRTLSAAGLLANSLDELRAQGLLGRRRAAGWVAKTLALRPTPLAGRLSFAESIAVPLIALLLAAVCSSELSGASVLLAYLGASLALSARASFRGAALALFGKPPRGVALAQVLGVAYVGPEGTASVLLERAPRIGAHLSALAGAAVVMGLTRGCPGLYAGATAVLLGDLCPFLPTSSGHLLSAISGHVDLAEHSRAYLSRRIVSRALATFFEGEGFLILHLVLSLGWFSLVIRTLWTDGVLAVLILIRSGLDEPVPLNLLSYFGAALLIVAMPAAIAALLWGLSKAVRSAFPRAASTTGTSTGGAVDAADLSTIPLFSTLEGSHHGVLARAAKELKYARGALIVRQGETGDAFYAIRTGRVVVERESDSGLVREVARLGPGDCFGELALLEAHPRMASVRALEVTVVAQISRGAFQEACAGIDESKITGLIRAAAALHKSRFFGRLPPERLGSLAARLQPSTVSAGATVVAAGDAGNDFYLVGTGALEVLDSHGQSVARLGPGDHFGEVALLRDVPRTATVRATEESLLLVLPKNVFLDAMAADLTLSSTLEVVAAERTGRLA